MFLESITNKMMKSLYLGQIDEESEDQIPNNDVGEDVHLNDNGK